MNTAPLARGSGLGNGAPANDRPVTELFQELAAATGTLVRQELTLAAGEMGSKARYAGHQVAFIAAGGALGLVALMALGAALTIALAMVLPAWSAALIVTAVYGAAGAGVVMKGVTALREMDATPAQTVRSLQETKSWAQEQVR